MTTVPAGLAAYPDATPTAQLAWTPSKTNWTNYAKDVNPAFLAGVNVSLVGQSDAQKEPAKTMNAWYTTNAEKIKAAGFTGDQLKVSSWAMLVDINFAKTAPKMYSAVQSGALANGLVNDTNGASTAVTGSNGGFCTSTAVTNGGVEFCLTEDATTNSLPGVCGAWDATCKTSAGCKKTECVPTIAAKTDGTSQTAAIATLTDKCVSLTAFAKPAVGDTGDEVGVMIWNKTATKKIPGIRVGRRVVANTNCAQAATPTKLDQGTENSNLTVKDTATTPAYCTGQTNEDFNESWTFTAPTVADWTDITKATGLAGTGTDAQYVASVGRSKVWTAANTAGTILAPASDKLGAGPSWTAAATCDTKKWADAKACNGIDLPWGNNSFTFPDGKGTAAVSGRWFRWLADNVTDKTAQFSVEKTDVLYVVLYEKWGKAPANNDGTSTNVVGKYVSTGTQTFGMADGAAAAGSFVKTAYKCQPVTHNWGIGSYTVAGASTVLIGASALVAGVAATLF